MLGPVKMLVKFLMKTTAMRASWRLVGLKHSYYNLDDPVV